MESIKSHLVKIWHGFLYGIGFCIAVFSFTFVVSSLAYYFFEDHVIREPVFDGSIFESKLYSDKSGSSIKDSSLILGESGLSIKDRSQILEKAGLSIKESSQDYDESGFFIRGVLSNNGDHSWSRAVLKVGVFDADDRVSNTCRRNVIKQINPGDEVPFKLQCPHIKEDSFRTYKVYLVDAARKFDGSIFESKLYSDKSGLSIKDLGEIYEKAGLSIKESNQGYDESGFFVGGVLSNSGNDSWSRTGLNAGFFSADDRVVNTCRGYVIKELNPGSEVKFKLECPHIKEDSFHTYQLYLVDAVHKFDF